MVPSQTPTRDGDVPASDPPSAQDEDKNEEQTDSNKTWVPSQTPTHNNTDFSSDETKKPDLDPNMTFVPSQTSTADGHRAPPGGHDSADESGNDGFDGTVAMGDLTDQNDVKTSDSEMGTVVVPQPDSVSPTDSAFAATMGGPIETDTENADDFSKTIGMGGLAEDEHDDWQTDASRDSTTDTIVGSDDGLSAPSDSAAGKLTQLWSKQSGDGLNIRSRPVAGDGQFGSIAKVDRPDYQIVKKLAEGGMGAIYIAKQTSLDRELAIKTLKPLKEREKKSYQSQGRMSQIEQQRREMFFSEALVTSNLVHPHIIPIHDLCQTVDEAPFYSMKLVNGTPWNELIVDMPQEENLEVLHKVCDAMAYAHHNGVVNRDLKPENVMLGEFGEVLVLDWGLAVPALESDKKQFASATASFGAGTPAYMSPELWTGPPEAISTWSDIYLLGAILFEAITGKAPHKFPEPDSKAGKSGLWVVIDSVVRQNIIRETSASGELLDIALKAMSTDRNQRHHTVLEFQEAIKEFQKHEESRHLANRATQTLAETDTTGGKGGYQNYQTAAALFDEAHVAWPENEDARVGLRNTRLAYAQLAHRKGDFDLGLQIAAREDGKDFADLTEKLSRARRLRNGLKYATMAAVMIIVVVGAISYKQTLEITELYGDKESLEQEKGDLEIAKTNAIKDQLIAVRAKGQAEELTLLAQRDQKDAEKKRLAAVALHAEAVSSLMKIEIEVDSLNQQKIELAADKARLTKEKVRADVDLRNASIASLIRSADYAGALQHVEKLMTALEEEESLAELPEIEKKERIKELKARQRQLLKRAHATEAPVQTQVISPSGRTIVWGDSEGELVVFRMEDASNTLPDAPMAHFSAEAAVSVVRISDDEDLIVAAAGTVLHLYRLSDNDHRTIEGHNRNVTTIELADGFLLAADSGGSIRAWDFSTLEQRWSIQSSSSIRDLAILPQAGCFLYAGSRGGESSDVLAYRLPPESSPTDRPERLGQLRFPRNRNYPANRIAVSPDERLLLISNSRNGEVMMLPRRADADTSERDRFPFVHAANLAADNIRNWVYGRHHRPVNDIEFSADGNRVVTASEDRSIGVWELSRLDDSAPLTDRMTLLQRLEGHGARVNAAGFLDPSGTRVLSASADWYCRFWNVSEYEDERDAIEKLFKLNTVNSLRPAGSIQPATVQQRPPQRIATVSWSADGQRLAAVVDGNLQIFSTATWQVEKVMKAPGLGIADAVFAPQAPSHSPGSGNSKHKASATDVIATFDGTAAHLWNLDNNAHLADFRPLFAVQSTALSDDSEHPLLLTGDRAVRIFQADADSPQYGHALSKISDPHRGVVTSLSFARGNRLFASGGADGSAALWEWNSDTNESRLVRWIRTEGAAIVHLAWSPDGRDILVVSADGHVSVVSTDDPGKRLMNIKVDAADPLQLECGDYSGDGDSIAVGGQMTDSGESVGWVYTINKDSPTRPHLHCTINGHDAGGIRSLAFPPDSAYIVTGGADGATIAWNWQPQRRQAVSIQAYEAYQFLVDGDVNAHQSPINSLAVSSNGNIATASDNGTAIVWKNPFAK
ncbi:MAG: protein kinase [Fuerstiella sp.]|nr:protein kinase [Fuerstiella sp.]